MNRILVHLLALQAGLRCFCEDRRGNMVILFALSLMPILGITGLAVDYSMTLRAKTALDASTDAAVLAAATQAAVIIQKESTPSHDATNDAITYGAYAGRQVFLANSAMIKTSSSPKLQLTLQRKGGVITADGTYTAQWPTVFGKMFGTSSFGVGGSASSSLNLPKYMNIYVATDISQSMGIAATQKGMAKLATLTKDNCVFGCHVVQDHEPLTNEEIAQHNGIALRIDVIKDSIKTIIGSAKSQSTSTPTISIGLYTLQERIPGDNTNYYNKIAAPSTDYDTLLSLANLIELGNNDSGGTGDSNFDQSVSLFSSNEVGASGDGSSSASKQSFVFLMTDGVQDTKGNCGNEFGHCTKPFDPKLCAGLKNKGVTIGVIYTTYIPIPSVKSYKVLVEPFQSQIAPNLRACASPGYYYEASEGPAIQAAVNALFAQAVASGRLTQ